MASISGFNTNGINFTGLATGINTDVLIEGLTRINQQRIERLKAQQQDIIARQSAVGTLKGYLLELQTKLNNLARTRGSVFDTYSATSSAPEILNVTAGASATPGTYTFSVESIAQAHTIASSGVSDLGAKLKQGTITLQVGAGQQITITVDSSNNTLQGLANAINSASQDIHATIINDGTDKPYKLLLTARKMGQSNVITITENLNSGSGAEITLNHRTLQQASDAVMRLGSGPGAIEIRSNTNQINSVIPGTTLNLIKSDPGRPINVTIQRDITKIKQTLNDMVETYNKIIDYINENSKYDNEKEQAGLFLGNREIQRFVNDLVSAIISPLSNSAGIPRLSSIGINLIEKNKLQIDENRLEQALANANETTIANLKKMFSITGNTDSPDVEFVLATTNTKPSNMAYQVHVTHPATQAKLTAVTSLPAAIIIQPPDNTLAVRLNQAVLLNIQIEPGVYTPEELAALLQRMINTHPENNGHNVSITLTSSNQLEITSLRYGSSSSVRIEGGTANSSLGFIAGQMVQGSDVQGYFVVNGVTELAYGMGQLLTGRGGNEHTDGLQLRIISSFPGTANVTVVHGIAARMSRLLDKYLNVSDGKMNELYNLYEEKIKDIDKQINTQSRLLEERKNQLLQQFTAMESAVSKLRNIQNQIVTLISPNISNRDR
ncbi:MAG: flagellar filament capping protein FliD [Thermogemmata sp.]|nr:flagellar filament capping protein FliD [Thermogemmata sp.]